MYISLHIHELNCTRGVNVKLTTKGRYAVTAMLDLALHNEDGPVTLADIADRQGISLSSKESMRVCQPDPLPLQPGQMARVKVEQGPPQVKDHGTDHEASFLPVHAHRCRSRPSVPRTRVAVKWQPRPLFALRYVPC